LDIFPIYPLDRKLWRYSLGASGEDVVPRTRVHHLGLLQSLARTRPWRTRELGTVMQTAAAVGTAALPYGAAPLGKSLYVLPKAWAWAARNGTGYDHVLAYWGNYAATCAYLFHRLIDRPIPFSIWLHAGTDLYLRPVYLAEKLRYADSVITCCEFNRGYLAEHYARTAPGIADRVHVCYHGLDLARLPYRPEGRPPRRIVAVGRLAKDKGFAFLLRAARLLQARGLEVEGEVVGDGLPNVLREAMALGTPVIASRIAGIPEALDDGRCGLLVPSGDLEALADAIARLLQHADLRQTFARLGRARAEDKFDMWRNGA